MKTSLKISGTVIALFVMSSFAFAELAGSKGNGSSASANGAPAEKTGCPAKPKLDPKTAIACPKTLGEVPLELDAAVEYEVEAYNPGTESYDLIGVEMPDEGTIPVTLESLAMAVKKGDADFSAPVEGDKGAKLKKSLASPCDLLKKKFKIKKIQTLSDADLKARKDCVRK